MASDYERADPAQNYAERRGITFRERVAEIVRKVVPESVRNIFDGYCRSRRMATEARVRCGQMRSAIACCRRQ
jgi:hypothetical protein